MDGHRFSTGNHFHWDGDLYKVIRVLPNDEINIENIRTTGLVIIRKNQLVDAFFSGNLNFESNISPETLTTSDQDTSAIKVKELADYTDAQIATAQYRLGVIQPLLWIKNRSRREICLRVEQLKKENGDENKGLIVAVSVPSVYRWLSAYEKQRDIRSLIPEVTKRGGQNSSKLEPETEKILQAVIKESFNRKEKVTIKDIYYLIAADIEEENKIRDLEDKLTTPSKSTVRRRLKSLDLYEKSLSKIGKRSTDRVYKQYGMMNYPSQPLDRVEIDSSPIDLLVVDENDNLPLGRLNQTKAIACVPRYPLGWHIGFEPPSYHSVMECLYHAILPKPDTKELYGTENQLLGYGIPNQLVVDNGKEFIGKDLEEACLQLGITLIYSPVRTPEFKATVERAFKTDNSLFHSLPGTTFSNIFERGEYDSSKYACITLHTLNRLMYIFMTDIYAQQYHRGLKGVPAQRWNAAMEEGFSPRLPKSNNELRILLGRIEQRRIWKHGVELMNIRYNTSELGILRHKLGERKTKIKYMPDNLSEIYVYDPFNETYIPTPALDQDYTAGLSYWKHKVISRFAREHEDKEDPAALGRAKEMIQEIVRQEIETRRTKRRASVKSGKKIARWDHAGKTPTASNLPPIPHQTDHPLISGTSQKSKSEDVYDAALTTDYGNDADLDEEDWGINYDLPKSSETGISIGDDTNE